MDAFKILGERLATIDRDILSASTTESTELQAKVVLKPVSNLSLIEFANSLKDKDMPLSVKVKGLTNSLCPASGGPT